MGFVGVVINYRLSPEISFPAFVEDAAAALRWAHTEAAGWGGDPERIFVMGHSAGGHIAALSILDREYLNDPGWLKGCIGLAGVYDFYPAPSLRPAFGRALAAGRRWSPIDMARRVGTPFLLLHGRRDLTVGAGNSRNLARRLKELGTPVQLELFNLGHMTLVATFLPGWRRVSSVPQTVKRFVESVQ